ncbi:hypothetical protein J4403_02760 [Candidatus Woesearchaeota archaeon]|nr:hypothetical protein [Candidatus Woesearchaeota archaeon]
MRIKRPDYKEATSIALEAERQMNYTLSLQVNDLSAFTIVRNIYECFRMLGDALLMIKGIKSKDHLEAINEITKLHLNTNRPISAIDNLRRLRHNINYYGYHSSIEEAQDILDFAKACFNPVVNEVRKKL